MKLNILKTRAAFKFLQLRKHYWMETDYHIENMSTFLIGGSYSLYQIKGV